jgi:salicylate hydroxylase
MHIYAPAHVAPDAPNHWGAPAASPALLLSGLGPAAEPRLHTLASLATPSSISAVRFPSLMLAAGDDDDEWMLPCAPGVVLGDAAHPPVPASVQAPAMALEDAAVLAKLFSHLRRRDQIPSLLGALATLRAERTRQVLSGDAATIMFSSLPYGADGVAEARDASMRAMTKAGRQAVGDDDANPDSNEQWAHIITTWAYGVSATCARTWTSDADNVGADAEDDADDWWASWGVIGERAQDTPKALAFDFGAGIVGVTEEEESA